MSKLPPKILRYLRFSVVNFPSVTSVTPESAPYDRLHHLYE